MPSKLDEILYRVEVLEGLRPGTPEHDLRVRILKATACQEKMNVPECSLCAFSPFCELTQSIQRDVLQMKERDGVPKPP